MYAPHLRDWRNRRRSAAKMGGLRRIASTVAFWKLRTAPSALLIPTGRRTNSQSRCSRGHPHHPVDKSSPWNVADRPRNVVVQSGITLSRLYPLHALGGEYRPQRPISTSDTFQKASQNSSKPFIEALAFAFHSTISTRRIQDLAVPMPSSLDDYRYPPSPNIHHPSSLPRPLDLDDSPRPSLPLLRRCTS
ncbi:hypothetical protein FA13DRAFT_1795000 [Coprinellus micaceus]|uniref:Uncharacterized protein n=1 Tax=Coprinellus micaceus TaxID=71717 RepID=A0A4Y7SZA9_COPMI|nr:hypothetical protein FA13DRAFT_1801515 [Coprinellus micaceus]TEB27190.1 hypothetical protein FA13DRAFT_1795000 [Coprinellus micaceus]